MHPPPGASSRRGAVAEGLVARTARRGQLVRVSVPDGRVSRGAAEAWSDSAMGGAAATPTSGVTGLNQATRNRSEAEVSRSRRVWASGCVSPTGARRDRSRDRPDRAERARAVTGGTEERSRSEGTAVSDRGRGRRPRTAGRLGDWLAQPARKALRWVVVLDARLALDYIAHRETGEA